MDREMRTGDIWLVKIREQSRPCFIIEDLGAEVEVALLSTKSLDRLGFTHILFDEIEGVIPKSKVVCEQYFKINKEDALKKICECTEAKMIEILKKINLLKQLEPKVCNLHRQE